MYSPYYFSSSFEADIAESEKREAELNGTGLVAIPKPDSLLCIEQLASSKARVLELEEEAVAGKKCEDDLIIGALCARCETWVKTARRRTRRSQNGDYCP